MGNDTLRNSSELIAIDLPSLHAYLHLCEKMICVDRNLLKVSNEVSGKLTVTCKKVT